MESVNERRLESSGVDKGLCKSQPYSFFTVSTSNEVPTVSFADTASVSTTSGAELQGMTELLSSSMQSSDADVYIKTTAKDFFLLDFFEEQVFWNHRLLMRYMHYCPLSRLTKTLSCVRHLKPLSRDPVQSSS